MMLISFDSLVARLGEASAWQCLVEIEKASGINLYQSALSPDVRLANAQRIQDAMRLEMVAA